MKNRAGKYGFLFVVYASLATPAFAYLDGATGSIILQGLIGAMATGLVYYRLFTAKAKALFARVLGKAPADERGGE
jgi:hypothetical protein